MSRILQPGHRLVRSATPPTRRVLVPGENRAPLGRRMVRALLAASPAPVRRAWRELQGHERRSVYAGAEQSRVMLDWIMSGVTPDEAVRGSMRMLRNRARDLERNNPYMKGYLRLHRLNVIGPRGPTHESTVRDNNGELILRVNTTIDSGWDEWSQDAVTIDGRWTLTELAKQLLTTMVRDGEAFLRLWLYFKRNRFGLALEPIAPEQVDETINRGRSADFGQNEIRLGVEVDEFGAPVQFWTKPHPSLFPSSREPIGILASEIIHLHRPDSVNQTRSVTHAHSFMVALHHVYAGLEANLVAMRTAASKMGFLQWRDGANPGEMGEDEDDIDPETGEVLPLESIPMEANAGSIEELPWGREFVGWDPQHPAATLDPFIKTNLRGFAAGGGPAYASMSKDVTGASYSSLRWDMNGEQDYWEDLQEYVISTLYRRVRKTWLRTAMLTGALRLPTRDPDDFGAHEWTPQGREWVDPLKEIEADILAVANGMKSRTECIARRGRTRRKVWAELATEKKDGTTLDIKIDGGLSPTTTDVNAPDNAGAGAQGSSSSGN